MLCIFGTGSKSRFSEEPETAEGGLGTGGPLPAGSFFSCSSVAFGVAPTADWGPTGWCCQVVVVVDGGGVDNGGDSDGGGSGEGLRGSGGSMLGLGKL